MEEKIMDNAKEINANIMPTMVQASFMRGIDHEAEAEKRDVAKRIARMEAAGFLDSTMSIGNADRVQALADLCMRFWDNGRRP